MNSAHRTAHALGVPIAAFADGARDATRVCVAIVGVFVFVRARAHATGARDGECDDGDTDAFCERVVSKARVGHRCFVH
jgi:hypothetical protein